jgi:Tol biopolymer transport system component
MKKILFLSTLAAIGVACSLLGFAQDQPPQGAKKPPEPAIPGLPELPPGVELPPEAREQLKKALQDLKALENSAKNKNATPAPRPVPASPVTPPPKPNATPGTTPQPTARVAPSPPAATTFQRVAVEKSFGAIGDLDLTKRSEAKPHFWVSPDGRRFAYLIDGGISIDGQPQRYENSLRQKDQFVMNFRFSPDSKRTSYVVHQGGLQGPGKGETLVLDGVPEKVGWNFISNHDGGVFSPDSQHVAYLARRYVKSDVEYVLMIDGQEREVFTKSPAWKLSFTPDSRRVVWAEDVGGSYQVRETSVDGKEPRVERKYGPAKLSMDFFYGPAGQLGFVASDEARNQFIVYDGVEHTQKFKQLTNLQLSRDGKHVAYVGEPESFRRVVVVDGKASKPYGGLDGDFVKNSLALSPVGGRYAYGIKDRAGQKAVVDGKEGKAYSAVAEFTFSPDGKWLAYWAAQAGKLHVVIEGKEGAAYDELGLPTFSPDGATLAYGAGLGQRKFIVVNGQPQTAYASIGEPAFSPDGKRLVYIADLTANGPTLLVDSGKEGKHYDGIEEDLYFSAGGQHVAMVAHVGDEELVVVDGVEGKPYDLIITLGGGKVQFDSEERFHYLAVKGGELFLVDESIEGK